MESFSVYRNGPVKRRLITVCLQDKRLKITGHRMLIQSLLKEGVTDFRADQHYPIEEEMDNIYVPHIFALLRERFERDSAYHVRNEPDPEP